LISLPALNGLRVSEAIGADVEDLGLERGHRALTILRKGGKVVTVPLAPRTARAVDLAVGERCGGPIFGGTDGRRIDRHAAGRVVRRLARRAGIAKRVGPHTLRHAFTPLRSTPACRCATSKRPEIRAIVNRTPTGLPDIYGIGPVITATIIGEVGDVTRFRDRHHFARSVGAFVDAVVFEA
jgi:integrase